MNQIYIRGNEIATKAYVDSLSLGGNGSALDNYYTKEEVNNLIEDNDGGSADLSNYYTKEEINNVIAEINNTIQKDEMPDPSEDNVGTIIQYIGDTNEYYTNSHFYQVVEQTIINEDGTETTIYVWEEIVSPEADLSNYYTKEEINNLIADINNSTQVEEMPEASAENKGTIIQYIGDTNNTYTTGYFYQVIEETIINEDGTETIIYRWEEISSPEINLDEYATKKYVDDTIGKLIGMGFTPLIVESLPTEDIKTNTIYMTLSEDGEGENIYEEWMYINNVWEKVGSTGVSSNSSYHINQSGSSDLISNSFLNEYKLSFDSANQRIIADFLPQLLEDYRNGIQTPIVFVLKHPMNRCSQIPLQLIDAKQSNNQGEYIFTGLHPISQNKIHFYKMTLNGKWSDNIFSLQGNSTLTVQNLNLDKMATTTYVDDAIATSIAGISTTSMEVATTLPTENISTSTIYLIKDETASTDTENIYNEYIYVNGKWENIGSTKTEVDLSNYYTKDETEDKIIELISNREPGDNNQSSSDLSNYYTKDETDRAITDAIADVKTTDFQISETLPTENISTNTIYLIAKEGEDGDVYEEYIYINNKWEKIGETTVDLSKYSTTEEMNAAIATEIAKIDLSKYLTSADAANTYATKTEVNNINNSVNNMYSKTEVNTAIETAISNITHPEVDLSNYYNKQEINDIIGDINALLDAINGEEV